MQGISLRNDMLDELDVAHDMTDGKVPDHLIVSEEVWNRMEKNNSFETLADKSNPKRPGYLGMKVWYSNTLDRREKTALLLSEQAFRAIVPTAKDFYR